MAKAIESVATTALAQSKLFRALSERGRKNLVERGVETKLAPGERLFSKGDAGDALYVVLEGEVEVGVATLGGRQVRFAALGAGAVLGELAVIDGGARSADATALRRTRLMRLTRAAVVEALESEPPALLALAAELAARLRAADAAIETAVLSDLGAKLAKHLLEESGAGSKLVQLTQVEMARRISVSREKLNRKLASWREEGVVEMTRSGLRVLDVAALTEIVAKSQSD
jgi:CRP/FNR family transcriptional regulator, cyclic AMP receptor protein